MYAWKCWRETRARFVVLLSLNLICVGLLAKVAFDQRIQGMHAQPHHMTTFELGFILLQYAGMAIVCFAGVAIAGGFILGATSMGKELEEGTAEYLWTRPQKRSSLLLTHWFVCSGELLALCIFPTFLILLFLGLQFGVWNFWQLPVAACLCLLPGLFFLGLTILMTAIRKSAASGLIFSLGATFGYLAATAYLHWYTTFQLPTLTIPLLNWTGQFATGFFAGHESFPVGATLRVVVLSFLFMLFAKIWMKRAEV